ncbi:MAG TPA: hypothetical protein VGK09_07300 [Rhodocyclaceae bacterium]|jgi:predicted Zn-dependent protease
MRYRAVLLALCFLLSTTSTLSATVRDQEIAECRVGEVVTWNDGTDRRAISTPLRFFYRHNEAPAWFRQSEVESLVKQSVQAWTGCGLPVELQLSISTTSQPADAITIEWSETGSRGNFALANLTRRTLSISPKAFAMLRERNPAYDAKQTLQMVLSHELGHFFGLVAHSRRCVDVLSYYNDGKGAKCYTRDPSGLSTVVEYRNTLPTACDIERCRTINGQPPLPGGRLPFTGLPLAPAQP